MDAPGLSAEDGFGKPGKRPCLVRDAPECRQHLALPAGRTHPSGCRISVGIYP
jgi:hypothetical protein